MVVALRQQPLPLSPLYRNLSMIIYSYKYYNKYQQIIKHYKDLNLQKSKELYTENHHIVPKSMGGSNESINLVRVPARVHFLLHWMLYRIYKTSSMAFAWNSFSTNAHGHRSFSKSYEYAKIASGKATTIMNTGKKHSEETKKKISISSINRSSKEYRDNMSKSCIGKRYSEETKKKMSISRLNLPRVQCPHCTKTGLYSNMVRWHFNNCKNYSESFISIQG